MFGTREATVCEQCMILHNEELRGL